MLTIRFQASLVALHASSYFLFVFQLAEYSLISTSIQVSEAHINRHAARKHYHYFIRTTPFVGFSRSRR
jgi:hypothetical protein